mmetsp:Transcript_36813/g.82986  ORF Transcript_36813/g.82986 Transcript_36813/m.82986 type:complete len:273 (+) Transcript_36813:343-1161(+)
MQLGENPRSFLHSTWHDQHERPRKVRKVFLAVPGGKWHHLDVAVGLLLLLRHKRRERGERFEEVGRLDIKGEKGPVAILGSEVIDLAPFVVKHGDVGSTELTGKVRVEEAKAAKSHVDRLLDDGGSGSEEEGIAVLTLSRSILLARKDALAVFTVSDEDAAFCGAHKDPAPLAIINLDLSEMIADVDVTIFTVFDDEHLAVNGSWHLDAGLPFEPGEHVIFRIRPLLLWRLLDGRVLSRCACLDSILLRFLRSLFRWFLRSLWFLVFDGLLL